MIFEWINYQLEDAGLVDSWMDAKAVAMTGIDQGWDAYWNAVTADAKNYPGCRDFCKIVRKNGMAVAAVVYGSYRGIATVSEIIVDPLQRGKGLGTQILLEWCDEDGNFHHKDWNPEDGKIGRSLPFDTRNRDGKLGMVSLIVDAKKLAKSCECGLQSATGGRQT